ncbi:uncharacterized protein KRP23_8689 [Phytophthora ramorum]|uniref:uncharacterized protein n=1 Tax=Phytophthora ramorum TaxID=164328 RepID=UPI00309ACC89|nr:hypothetical protein KRP23_8689 [Phytophthora ramorum]
MAASSRGDEVQPLLVHEVIVISSDDESDGDEDEDTIGTNRSGPLHWSEVIDRLLLLAEHRDLRRDGSILTKLLQDLGIPQSRGVKLAIHGVCNKLAKLLAFCRDHPRRLRACEDLVAVICKVLSLAQTVPMQGHGPFLIKEEMAGHRTTTMQRVCQLMEPWIAQLLADGGNRENAISATISRLETTGNDCTRDIKDLHEAMAMNDREKENIAQEWVNILAHCRTKAQQEDRTPSETESKLRDFHEAFYSSPHVQARFVDTKKAHRALAHRAHEMELRREFYRAALHLTCLVNKLPSLTGLDAGSDEW